MLLCHHLGLALGENVPQKYWLAGMISSLTGVSSQVSVWALTAKCHGPALLQVPTYT